jgi:hypothetical protein
MRRLAAWLTPERTITLIMFTGIATLACLSPAHNDTWWHLRSGQEVARTRAWMSDDRFTFTVHGAFFWNPAWLAQLIFYGLWLLGGFQLLTFVCAGVIVAAWAIVWRLMRGPFTDRLLLLAVALSSATMTWSVRPQVFSLLGSMVVIRLAAHDRWRWLPPLFVLWANLHAGFAMGIALLIAAVVAAVVHDRDRLWTRLRWTTVCGLATLITPFGLENWRQIVASIGRSSANAIQEWQPTAWPPQQVAFWGLAVVVAIMAIRRWKSLEEPADRVLLVAAIVTFPLAVRSLRNVPTFMMIAAPALSRVLHPRVKAAASPAAPQRHPPRDLGMIAAALLAGLFVVASAWRQSWPMLGWRPIDSAEARAIAACPAPLYNTYESGGPIIWFVPSQPVFIDSRQDPFPVSFVQEATAVEATGNYEATFAKWHINCAALPPQSPTAARLAKDGWRLRFSDGRWQVLERPAEATTAATPLPAR